MLTPPQSSPIHKEDTQNDSTKQKPLQRSTSDLSVSNASYTKPHELKLGINSTVCLPQLDLPIFSGDAMEFQPFSGGCNAAVNSYLSISDIQKLNYLRSQLCGKASLIIAGVSLTSAIYNHSVVMLKDCYGQPQKLNHMQALLDLHNPSNTLCSLVILRCLSILCKSVNSYGDC